MNNLNVINNLVKILIEKIRKIVKSKTCHFKDFMISLMSEPQYSVLFDYF